MPESDRPSQRRTGIFVIIVVALILASFVGGWFARAASGDMQLRQNIDALYNGKPEQREQAIDALSESVPGIYALLLAMDGRGPNADYLELDPNLRIRCLKAIQDLQLRQALSNPTSGMSVEEHPAMRAAYLDFIEDENLGDLYVGSLLAIATTVRTEDDEMLLTRELAILKQHLRLPPHALDVDKQTRAVITDECIERIKQLYDAPMLSRSLQETLESITPSQTDD